MCIFLDIQNHDFVVFGRIWEKWAHFSALAILQGKDTYLFCSCCSQAMQPVGTSSEPTAERIRKKPPQKNSEMGKKVRPLSAAAGSGLRRWGSVPPCER